MTQEDYARLSLGFDPSSKQADWIVRRRVLMLRRLSGRRLDFTHQEFELLRFLAQNRGRVFTRDQLLQKVWGYQYTGGTRTVDIHIRRLRAKLGPVVGALIATVRHVGYKMRAGK